MYNIYDYDEQNPVVWDYDIGRCFNISQKRDFKFILPGIFSIDILIVIREENQSKKRSQIHLHIFTFSKQVFDESLNFSNRT